MPISNPKINLPLIKVVRFQDINLSGILTSLLFSSFGKKNSISFNVSVHVNMLGYNLFYSPKSKPHINITDSFGLVLQIRNIYT